MRAQPHPVGEVGTSRQVGAGLLQHGDLFTTSYELQALLLRSVSILSSVTCASLQQTLERDHLSFLEFLVVSTSTLEMRPNSKNH